MVCRYCRNPIGIIQRLVDKEFCSKEHRTAYSARSARALREMGEFTYSVADVLRDTDEFAVPKKKRGQAAGPRSMATVLALAGLSLAGLIIVERMGIDAGPKPKKERDGSRQGAFATAVGGLIDRLPKSATGGITIEDRFQTGLRSWLPAPGSGPAGWRSENGLVKPGGLRIWNESRNLADYSFQFEGRVESNLSLIHI